MVVRGVPEVRLVYFEDCPHWRIAQARLMEAAQARLMEALAGVGGDPDRVVYQQVTTAKEAAAAGFGGSPTILVDGTDPFADPSAGVDGPVALGCRLYRSAAGSEPAP